MLQEKVIVAGLGEVGRPLLRILQRSYQCVGIDLEPVEVKGDCHVLHVCYPYQIEGFVSTTVEYVRKFTPRLTIINSTVAIGTTREVQKRVECRVAYSPVRGKHARMEQEMLSYRKFLVGCDAEATAQAAEHFSGAGFHVATFPNPEAGELSKLIETTWLGMLVGWAQDIERMAAECGVSYDDVNEFIKEIGYLPAGVFPGHIGGHCVMPNIAILRQRFSSQFLDAVVASNESRWEEEWLGNSKVAAPCGAKGNN